jgi:4-carboxymuconolactone decarboxylase
MPRLPIPSDAEPFEEETRAAVRHIQQTRKSMPPPSSYHTSLTDAETELAICTAARAADGAHIWSAHVKLGLKAGAREEAFHAIDTYAPLDDLTADEALIIGFGRELLESPQVSDETFAAVRARYGERGLMEITAAMSVYMMNATILRVMDHQAAADARLLTPR